MKGITDFGGVVIFENRDKKRAKLFSGGSSPLCVFNNIKLKYKHVVKYTTNFIRYKGAIIDYMFRPFFIRPSSVLAWRSREELVQLYKVQKVHYLG